MSLVLLVTVSASSVGANHSFFFRFSGTAGVPSSGVKNVSTLVCFVLFPFPVSGLSGPASSAFLVGCFTARQNYIVRIFCQDASALFFSLFSTPLPNAAATPGRKRITIDADTTLVSATVFFCLSFTSSRYCVMHGSSQYMGQDGFYGCRESASRASWMSPVRALPRFTAYLWASGFSHEQR